MTRIAKPIFDKVVFIGPDKRGNGGISVVLNSYSESFEPFHYLPTNSQSGRLQGYLTTLCTALRIPFQRLKGRRIGHIHYASGKSWKRKVILMNWMRLWGLKPVMHCHSAAFKEFCNQKGTEKVAGTLRKAKANVVLSQAWNDYFTHTLGLDNVHTVNNIVAKPQAYDITRNPVNSPLIFLFLGYLGDRKGIFDILKAAKALKAEGLNFRLIVGGNGEVDRFREEVSRLELDDVVDFRGWISGDMKTLLLAECDVLLLPSHAEGLPISILEAMSFGKAVLTTGVGGIPDVITDSHNGTLVTPGNVDSITRGMKAYIDDRTLAASHGANSAEIIKNFYPNAVADQLEKIYRKLLN